MPKKNKTRASSNSKTRKGGKKSRPLTLYNLPPHILEQVNKNLSLVDCLVLRKICRPLRSFVDSNRGYCRQIAFVFNINNRIMQFDDLKLVYRKEAGRNRRCMVTSKRLDAKDPKMYGVKRNFKQALIDDAGTFLKNPKLEIGCIEFEVRENGQWSDLMKFLKSLDFQLSVRKIQGNDLNLLQSVQQYLKPEPLEKIFASDDYSIEGLIEIADSDLLSNPKLSFNQITLDNYDDELAAETSEIFNAHRFEIGTLLVEDLEWIPLILRSVNPERLEEMTIQVFREELSIEQFNEIAGNEQWKSKTRLQCDLPEEIEIEDLIHFKEVLDSQHELSEENLIKIRDIIIKSPHLDLFELLHNGEEGDLNDDEADEINEMIDRVMSEDPSYDASTRRFSIPNSTDYFQLEVEGSGALACLTIQKMSQQ